MDDLISRLSEIRSSYNCMDETEEPYYRALSEAIRLASAQPEQGDEAIFWKKRAREYEDIIADFVAEQAKGIKFDSITITEEGITFKKSQPERTGKWIRWYETKEDETGTEYIPHCRCSKCGTEYDPHSSKFVLFCNVCGARMERRTDDLQ